ncbi:toll-like receptor 1, partial [Mercenaria mercenaria]|uniref:toll-like receptor 1 n=1 Tax=Mercenaria mercenaria TaxID=6596 RepID=UPI00234EDE35
MEISDFTSTNLPELPANKDFHVFVCYKSDNVDQVRIIVSNLEECGMKCYYHDRDFIPGESIIGNTHDGMKRSVGMLIVLTEEFGNSRFCSFELNEALHMKISEHYFLVPVKLEPCQVPDCLRHISYIDAEDEPIDRVHLKIAKAFVDR